MNRLHQLLIIIMASTSDIATSPDMKSSEGTAVNTNAVPTSVSTQALEQNMLGTLVDVTNRTNKQVTDNSIVLQYFNCLEKQIKHIAMPNWGIHALEVTCLFNFKAHFLQNI